MSAAPAHGWRVRCARSAIPAWTADGFVSDVWLPVSPATGRIDAFEWKVPVADLQGPMIESDDGVTELEALPPAKRESAAQSGAAEKTIAAPSEDDNGATAQPAPRTAASDTAAARKDAAATDAARAPEPVIPLIHAPDDPGPDAPEDATPVAAPRGDGRGFRTLFK